MSSDAANVVDPRVREAELNHRLLLDREGRQFVPVAGSRWGELILPAPGEAEGAGAGGLRLVMFSSYEFGYLALETVKAYARRFPGRVQLVGLATDDPMNTEARIGLKKRLWKHVSREEVVAIETAVVEAALVAGAPAFTGEIKPQASVRCSTHGDPDAIVSCMFGQVIDAPIIERPAYGIYNFHPTDLAHGFGPGPTPVEDLAAHGMTSTVWTIHHVIEAVDAGGVVAVSPQMNIADPDGKLPADPLIAYDKLLEPVGSLVASLIDALSWRFAAGRPGKLDHLDVEAALPAAVKSRMQEPIRAVRHVITLPVFDPAQLESFA